MKTCNKCNVQKQITDFDRDSALKDGRKKYCKSCRTISQKKLYRRAVTRDPIDLSAVLECSVCASSKPASEFPKKPRTRRGVGTTCNSCRASQMRELRARNKAKGIICGVDSCDRPAHSGRLCIGHRKRKDRLGEEYDPYSDTVPIGHPGKRRSTPQSPGRWPTGTGYILCVFYDDLGVRRSILEHRKVMQESIGRDLYPEETVHHLNGVRDDNRIENLELWSSHHPKGQRSVDKTNWAIETLIRYLPEALNDEYRPVER